MSETKRALIIVDVQPGFCEGGSLAVDGGNACAERIADFVTENADEYELLVSTQDWHIDPGEHFSDTPDFVDTWPTHCVAGTDEAELHEAIAALSLDVSVKKGQYEAAYSGFQGEDAEERSLETVLREAEIEAVDVVGIAESHCVKATALDALNAGWPVRVFSDLTVPVSEELGEEARAEMDEAGIEQLESSEAFGFYEEPEDEAIPGDTDGDLDPDDGLDIEDNYDDDANAEGHKDDGFAGHLRHSEVDDEGAFAAAASENEDLDALLADFDDIDIDDEGLDFSAEASDEDFDFSDIDDKPGL